MSFSPAGTLPASADETVKLCRTATGERLDTLGPPEGEQYAVLFTPNGDGAGRNLPHGVYVDNIGLHGVLLLAD